MTNSETVFTEHAKALLRNCGLSKDVIMSLEQEVVKDRAMRLYTKDHASSPTAKEQRQTLNRLKKAVDDLSSELQNVSIDNNLRIHSPALNKALRNNKSLLDDLAQLKQDLEKVTLPSGKPGNKQKSHFETTNKLVREIARALVLCGITVTKTGQEFHTAVETVFDALGEKSSVRLAIDSAWTDVCTIMASEGLPEQEYSFDDEF